MRLIQVAPILGIQDEYAARIAQLGLKLSMPMWIGFIGSIGFVSYLSYVPGLDGLGLQRISGFFGFFGFFGFSGFLGLFGVASLIDSHRRRRFVQKD